MNLTSPPHPADPNLPKPFSANPLSIRPGGGYRLSRPGDCLGVTMARQSQPGDCLGANSYIDRNTCANILSRALGREDHTRLGTPDLIEREHAVITGLPRS